MGYSYQQLEVTVYAILGICLFQLFLFVPAWPLYKQNDLEWLSPEAVVTHPSSKLVKATPDTK